MSYYRSQSVKHYKLVLPRDNAQQIMQIIGENNLIHILPIYSTDLSKPYVGQIKRINDCLIKIKEIQKLLIKKQIIQKKTDFTKNQFQNLFQQWHNNLKNKTISKTNFLVDVDRQVQQIWKFYIQATNQIQQIKKKIIYIRQNIAILKSGSSYFGKSFIIGSNNLTNMDAKQFQLQQYGQSQINMKVGIINKKDEYQLKKTIFRISRNNCFIIFFPFQAIFATFVNPEQNEKLVFLLIFSGNKDGYLYQKICTIIKIYCNKQYNLPKYFKNCQQQLKLLQQQQKQHNNTLLLYQQQLQQHLRTISTPIKQQQISKIQNIQLYLIHQRQIYNKLNDMQQYKNFIQGNIFILYQNINLLQKCFKDVQEIINYPSGQIIQAKQAIKLPTYFSQNLFMNTPQTIVQTYGIPAYKQANPAFFTVITFPFLFGVMFGDIAHGSILMGFGIWLIFQQKDKQPDQIASLFLPHKYTIFLMGFFATYCGFIYNDFMSISLNIFISCYDINTAVPGLPIRRLSPDCVYPLGIDPIWSVSDDQMNYVNSLKMKIAVIIGVIHMTLGIFLKASNSIYFRKWLDVFFQFIPQLVFLLALFGYMDFLIIYKWIKYWDPVTSNPPSIITTMVNMVLKLGKTEDCCGGEPMWGTYGDTSQDMIQLILLILAVICLPLMFVPKPLLLIRQKKKHQHRSDYVQQLIQQKEKQKQNQQLKQTQNQIWISQLIETTQYGLGCISNTASYLRLWALSLAHSQLAEVFFQMTVQKGFTMGYSGIGFLFGTFPVLFGATFGILLCMDSMECFLHALRLHWVEFQNKFYKGSGFKFQVFSFKNRIKQQIQAQ